ncbi:2-oxoglutarate synthase subunit alpha [Candidatus Bathyarchaeota archaeon RBG_13_60_20]|nr:MAG: 2-oxoglutarate synthase subunit alpha [Candidatus Bathyarchaeota archaeon RBG_13_60_20]
MLEPGRHLTLGNVACAEGALRAGCRFFAGYPITPASEISHHLSAELPKVGGVFLQMEDEIASMSSVIGASWAGAKAMTATSGPGYSLMQENIGYAHMTETPLVVVNVQRSGPSTGQSTDPSQQDIYQARYGAHGDYEVIAISPWSVQEMFDLTVRAFNLAEAYRTPVMLMSDGLVAHIQEKLVVPEKVEVVDRRKPTSKSSTPWGTDDPSLVPEMPAFGEGHRLLVTGSTHRPDGMRIVTPQYHQMTVYRIRDKILNAEPKIRDIHRVQMEDAEVAVLSFGASARPSLEAVNQARGEGIKAGLFRLKTIWPFPEEDVSALADQVDAVIVVEMNFGKLVREVERVACGRTKVVSLGKIGGQLHMAREVLEAIRGAAA